VGEHLLCKQGAVGSNPTVSRYVSETWVSSFLTGSGRGESASWSCLGYVFRKYPRGRDGVCSAMFVMVNQDLVLSAGGAAHAAQAVFGFSRNVSVSVSLSVAARPIGRAGWICPACGRWSGFPETGA
jgi:hypothetical protein